ncbi:MAG TPA: quinone-dependent dihydroorotate dehydrogenase [bacterium]|nr:quinone-dependent dihydroorotate dehydrogenase [bacterium]
MSLYSLIRPLLFALPPETAHRAVLHGLAGMARLPGSGPLLRALGGAPDAALQVELWGLRFPNPVGVAAGLDKDGVALAPLLALGCGFVEAGTVTPRPQPGNPRPRLFRLPADRALINRMGFNNAGTAALAGRLQALRAAWPGAIVGVNLGKNRDTPLEAAAGDYVAALQPVYALADYLVINVSSPNTPGLRGLQARAELQATVSAVAAARARRVEAGERRVPLLVKVAPELDEAALADVVSVALDTGCDGLIATNTTLSREGLRSPARDAAGGLSGEPLRPLALRSVATLYRLSAGRLPLVGVGGIASAEHAYALIRAGASLVQVYTGLIYEGPGLIRRVRRGLVHLLTRDGFSCVAEAVGTAGRT